MKPAGISVPQFFELHARLNYLVKHYPSVALCQYHIEHLEVPHLFSAIAVHRHLLVKGAWCGIIRFTSRRRSLSP